MPPLAEIHGYEYIIFEDMKIQWSDVTLGLSRILWYGATTAIGASSNHLRARAEETPEEEEAGGGVRGEGMAAYCPWKRVMGCDCRTTVVTYRIHELFTL